MHVNCSTTQNKISDKADARNVNPKIQFGKRHRHPDLVHQNVQVILYSTVTPRYIPGQTAPINHYYLINERSPKRPDLTLHELAQGHGYPKEHSQFP